jgi:vitamin B12 transporter
MRAAYTHVLAKDEITDFRLPRRPEHEGRIGFAFTPWTDLPIEPAIVFVGQRYADLGETQKQPPYARLDALADYRLNNTASLFVRAENLTDVAYEEVPDFGTASRSPYAGLRATW